MNQFTRSISLLLLVAILAYPLFVLADSSGPWSPDTVVDDTSIGTNVWSNPSNAIGSDNSRATAVTSPGSPSHYLKATDFDFAIPTGATIDGIEVTWEKIHVSGGGSRVDNAVRIVKGGTIGATDKSDLAFWSSISDQVVTYGGASDLWGETWTAADINATTFGAALSVKTGSGFGGAGGVDDVTITVYYTEAGPAPVSGVMSSTSYRMQSDSVNFGGNQSNSNNYRVEDTLGEVATGESASTNYRLKAGYQQMNTVYLAMTSAADVTMSPSLGGLTGGTSNGSTNVTVTTDSAAGYVMYFNASNSPAMRGNTQGDSIANYTPAGSDPDFTFSVPGTAAEFGFSPEGTDIAAKYLDNGSACNTGSTDTSDACWNAVSTTNDTIVQRTSANQPSGTVTTLKFRLTINPGGFVIEDTYNATTTLTAVAL